MNFKVTLEHGTTKVTIEVEEVGDTWRDLLPYIEQALRGLGFSFYPNMELDMVDTEITNTEIEDT